VSNSSAARSALLDDDLSSMFRLSESSTIQRAIDGIWLTRNAIDALIRHASDFIELSPARRFSHRSASSGAAHIEDQ
jgi:hypothetical protein